MKMLLPLIGALALAVVGCQSTGSTAAADGRSIDVNNGGQARNNITIPADSARADQPYAVRGSDAGAPAGNPAAPDAARRGTNGNY